MYHRKLNLDVIRFVLQLSNISRNLRGTRKKYGIRFAHMRFKVLGICPNWNEVLCDIWEDAVSWNGSDFASAWIKGKKGVLSNRESFGSHEPVSVIETILALYSFYPDRYIYISWVKLLEIWILFRGMFEMYIQIFYLIDN